MRPIAHVPLTPPPRIGLTGSAGTGKSTLAQLLAGRLGVPVVAEAMRPLLATGFDLHALSRCEHRDLLRRQADRLAATMARAEGGFVTDRTPLDFLGYWLSNGFGVEEPGLTDLLAQRAVAAMADYTAVVLLPWGAIPLVADGVRSTNPWHQLHFQTLIEGLCRRWVAPERLLLLPEDPLTADARLAWVLKRTGCG